MIDMYTKKENSKDWIIQNDLFFNLYTSNEEMLDNETALIKLVDNAKLTSDKHIETIYGLGTIHNLSSGCKTLLNHCIFGFFRICYYFKRSLISLGLVARPRSIIGGEVPRHF